MSRIVAGFSRPILRIITGFKKKSGTEQAETKNIKMVAKKKSQLNKKQ